MVGYFDWGKEKYLPILINSQVEVITLVGDIAEDEKGAPSLHAHTVLGLEMGAPGAVTCWKAMCAPRWK